MKLLHIDCLRDGKVVGTLESTREAGCSLPRPGLLSHARHTLSMMMVRLR